MPAADGDAERAIIRLIATSPTGVANDLKWGESNVEVDPDAREWRTRDDEARGRRGGQAGAGPGEDQAHRHRPQLHRYLYAVGPLQDAAAECRGPRGRRRDPRGRAEGEGLQEGRPGRLLRRARRLLRGTPDRHGAAGEGAQGRERRAGRGDHAEGHDHGIPGRPHAPSRGSRRATPSCSMPPPAASGCCSASGPRRAATT